MKIMNSKTTARLVKTWKPVKLIVPFLAAVLLTTARGEEMVKYKSKANGSKVSIIGTSNVHDWTMDGTLIAGFFEVPPAVEFDQAKADLPGVTGGKLDAHAETSIAVTSLHGSWSGMDPVMQAAMNANEHPTIQYHLTEMTLKQPHAAGTPFEFDAKGELVVNGVTNVLAMPASIQGAGANKLKITGKVSFKMTDYKVTPPVKFGLFKTDDAVTITFEWIVGKPAPKP